MHIGWKELKKSKAKFIILGSIIFLVSLLTFCFSYRDRIMHRQLMGESGANSENTGKRIRICLPIISSGSLSHSRRSTHADAGGLGNNIEKTRTKSGSEGNTPISWHGASKRCVPRFPVRWRKTAGGSRPRHHLNLRRSLYQHL